jgi:hypothetical protein
MYSVRLLWRASRKPRSISAGLKAFERGLLFDTSLHCPSPVGKYGHRELESKKPQRIS